MAAAPLGGVRITRLLPPEEWRKRQLGTLRDVGERNYRQGIALPSKDTIQAGIDAEPVYAARTKQAIEEGRRAKALRGTSMQEWYAYADTIGAPKLVDGVLKREAKVKKFIDSWVPLLESHLASIDKMPKATDKEAEDKMLANLRGLKALHGKWRPGG
jgi:hypothetical protein